MNREALNKAAAAFVWERFCSMQVVGSTKSGRVIAEMGEPGPAERRWRTIEAALKGQP